MSVYLLKSSNEHLKVLRILDGLHSHIRSVLHQANLLWQIMCQMHCTNKS